MKTKITTTKTKKPTKAELLRTEKLRQEIFSIFQETAHQYFKMMESRDDVLQKRLNSIEQIGVPENPIQEIKTLISGIRHKQHLMEKGFRELLSFFNISQEFFNEAKKDNI